MTTRRACHGATGHQADIAKVGIQACLVLVITEDRIAGKETIDAAGPVVAPGFIDTHFHSIDPFATKMVVANGITTDVDLEVAYVIVNGTTVVKEGEVLTVRPGQPIRFPIETKARHEPVTVNKWLRMHAINVPSTPVDDTGAGAVTHVRQRS